MLKRIATYLAIVLLSIPVGSPGGIFWSDEITQTIYRGDLDGLNVAVLVAPPDSKTPGALALDPVAGKIYWAGYDNLFFSGLLRRANLDGTGVEPFGGWGSEARPGGLVVNRKTLKLYFTDPSDCIPDCGAVLRVGLDSGTWEPLVSGSSPGALALDEKSMWWVSDWDDVIYRSPLDGGVKDPVITNTETHGIAVDGKGGKLYWTDAGAIHRAKLDGSSHEVVVGTGVVGPHAIVLDLEAKHKKMYWTDRAAGKIQRANLDGSGVEDLFVGLPSPTGLAVLSDDDEGSDDENRDDEGDDRPKMRFRTPFDGRHQGATDMSRK